MYENVAGLLKGGPTALRRTKLSSQEEKTIGEWSYSKAQSSISENRSQKTSNSSKARVIQVRTPERATKEELPGMVITFGKTSGKGGSIKERPEKAGKW